MTEARRVEPRRHEGEQLGELREDQHLVALGDQLGKRREQGVQLGARGVAQLRIGQDRHVQVRKFVCVGTLEERIDEMIAAKRELSALTVQAGEGWLADLGDAEVLDLLALRDDAVSE